MSQRTISSSYGQWTSCTEEMPQKKEKQDESIKELDSARMLLQAVTTELPIRHGDETNLQGSSRPQTSPPNTQ